MKLKIAGVQMDVTLGQVANNVERIIQWMKRAVGTGATLVVFPECATTGYCFESADEALQYAEPNKGPTCEQLIEVCQELQCHTVYGFLETRDGKLYNSLNLIGPNGWVGTYRKIHLPFLGVDRFTEVGDSFEVFEIGGVRIGMHICYDGSFPESSRCLSLKGADLLVLPTNWPPGSKAAADVIPNARAMENHVYFMSVNRVGIERGFEFIGKSKICDPDGMDVIFENHREETLFTTEIDCQISRAKKLVRVPGKHEIDRFEDRQPDKYSTITDAKNSPTTHRE